MTTRWFAAAMQMTARKHNVPPRDFMPDAFSATTLPIYRAWDKLDCTLHGSIDSHRQGSSTLPFISHESTFSCPWSLAILAMSNHEWTFTHLASSKL